MLSTTSLIKNIKSDFPQFIFKKAPDFLWSNSENTVYYAVESKDCSFLFHELSHAILNHSDYNRDIELVVMERQAWDKAKEIATKYGVTIDEEFIQDNLDTYRDWLHDRSTCPKCQATGIQIKKNQYKCIVCSHVWLVNEARTCALKRYSLKDNEKTCQ